MSTLVEITNISSHGIWIFYSGKEYFAPYTEFPWFKEKTLGKIQNVIIEREGHLRWPELDIDLTISMLENPEKFTLVAKG